MSGASHPAHRTALDHVLAVIARSPWADALVLRGSMAMLAWVGPERAREPGDLDWIVLPPQGLAVDAADPHPYVRGFDAVQEWPEAGDGAASYELFRDEADAFDTGGIRALVPPEGTAWIEDVHTDVPPDPASDVIALLTRLPDAGGGVRIDAAKYRLDDTWAYEEYDSDPPMHGVRLLLPWTSDDGRGGEVQIDFARDETLPCRPEFALVPRLDGREPALVRAAGPDLSLAWKLLWLDTDSGSRERARGKDLYDAVLLAESPRTRLDPALLRRVLRRARPGTAGELTPDDITRWSVDWHSFRAAHPRVHGDLDRWLARLSRALAPVLAPNIAGC